jgi:hypothetical protein
MNSKMHTKIFLLLIITFSNYAYADLFGSSSYEDCVLKGIKDAKTDAAVGTVHNMCRKKFSTESNKIPGLCLIYWNGLRSTKLTSEPKNWRENYAMFSISRYGNEVAHVFTQKDFKSSPESEAEIYRQVQYTCQ